MPIARKATVFWETTDHETVRLYQGDVLETLQRLPSGSVQCIITSPPYFGLRDYGTGTWEGGDPNCKHGDKETPVQYLDRNGKPGRNNTNWDHPHGDKNKCARCGAKRTDHQLGSEKSPDCLGWARGVNCAEENWEEGCHVCRMVLVFREVRRVLRDDGTLWLNYGSSYGQDGQMVAVPWLVALALQADGWILRQDIIWAKPSPMPESVKNRCTKAHEYVFLFAKKGGYFCDMEAVKEKAIEGTDLGLLRSKAEDPSGKVSGGITPTVRNPLANGVESTEGNPTGNRNKRSVWKIDEEEFQQFLEWKAMNSGNKLDWWNIASESYPGAHFATFPSKLITPMIKAGTSEKGCCSECGAPWKRVIEENKLTRERPNDYVKRTGEEGTGNSCSNSVAGVETRTVGWEPSCECNGRFEKRKVKKKTAKVGEKSNTSWAVGQESHDVKDYQTEEGRENNRVNSDEYERTVSEYVCNCGVRWGVTGKPDNSTWEERKKAGADSGSKVVGMNTNHGKGMSHDLDPKPFRSIEREMPCDCYEDKISPCIVLDPFCGSGTTNAVCIALGRNSIGIELSKDYLVKNAIPRVEGELLSRPALAYLVPRAARKSTMVGEDITG